MNPEAYDAWYKTPRGSWIGEQEFQLLNQLLSPKPGSTLLDAGCGSGFFSRQFGSSGIIVTGIDPSYAMVKFAQSRRISNETYLAGDARSLPFPDKSFDYCTAVTSLCFIQEQQAALSEMLRVTRRRIVLGLLNRHSLLYWQKGKGGGVGAYRGAHWHTSGEIRSLFKGLPVSNLVIRSTIFLPGGGMISRMVESILPHRLAVGGFIAVAGDIGPSAK